MGLPSAMFEAESLAVITRVREKNECTHTHTHTPLHSTRTEPQKRPCHTLISDFQIPMAESQASVLHEGGTGRQRQVRSSLLLNCWEVKYVGESLQD